MYYISSRRDEVSGIYFGVTDTKDGIEEVFPRSVIEEQFKKGVRIKGLTYTGSSFRYEIMSLCTIELDSMENGTAFILVKGGIEISCLYAGKSSLGNFRLFDGSKAVTLTRKDLRDDIYQIKDGVSKERTLALVKDYVDKYPLSSLSLHLSKEYNL